MFGIWKSAKQKTKRKVFKPKYSKHNSKWYEVNDFRTELKNCLVSIKITEEVFEIEVFIKIPISTFLKNTFYFDNLVNTKWWIDLAIYAKKDLLSDIGIIIEAKKPSNNTKFLTQKNLNGKAFQELLLYCLK